MRAPHGEFRHEVSAASDPHRIRTDTMTTTILALDLGTTTGWALRGSDGRIYAVAQGPLLIGGLQASGYSGSVATRNHVTTVPGNAALVVPRFHVTVPLLCVPPWPALTKVEPVGTLSVMVRPPRKSQPG